MRQSLGIGGRVQEGPRQARGEERSGGTHSSPQAAGDKNHTEFPILCSRQVSRTLPGGSTTSPLLGFQGLLLAPGLVPRGWGVDVSHGRWRHLCHGLLGSWLLVGSPSLRFPPFGPSVLEPNLSPPWKCTSQGGRKSDRSKNPNAWIPSLRAHGSPCSSCVGGPASSLRNISQNSALWTAASDPKMGQKISVEGMTGIFLK